MITHACSQVVLDPPDFMGIMMFVICKTKSRGLAVTVELAKAFCRHTDEEYICNTTTMVMQQLLKEDTNELFNEQIRDDMR